MSKANIMNRMTARDIAKNFLQYLSMIVITMLAITLFCGFISNAETLRKTLDDYYESSNLTDIIAQFSAISESDKTFLNTLDTERIEYRFYSEGSVDKTSAKIYVSDSDNKISLPLIIEGERGVLVDSHVAKRDNLEIGTEIELEFPFSTASFVITGIMNFAEVSGTHIYSPVYLDFDVLFEKIPYLTKDMLINQALIKTKYPALIKDEINAHYDNLSPSPLVFVYDRDSMESIVMLNNEVTQSLNMIYVFPVIFLLVSVLVILSTIRPLILRERTNIGTLKGIGVTNTRILLHYSGFGAVLCLIGGILGVILGPFIVPNVLLIKYNLVYSIPPHSGIVFSLFWSVFAVLAVCLMAAVIGFLVCYKSCREKPAACMRPLPPKDNFLLKKTSGGIDGTSRSISFKMATRNIILQPSRALMTIIGIMGCVALLTCSFGIGDTVENSIDLELGRQFTYDVSTTFTQSAYPTFINEIELLKSDGKIDHYENYKTFYMTATGKNIKDIRIYALPQNPQLTTINPNGQTLISKSVAEDLQVRAGDAVLLSSAGNSFQLTIDALIETSYTKGIFISDDTIFEDSFCTLSMWIKTSNPSDELVDRLNEFNGTRGASTMTAFRESVDKTVSSIETIKMTMMIFSIALAVVVLYNLSLLNIKERNRDIATMKVLGFTQFQIGLSLLYEIMILVLLGTAFGLLLGYPITYLVLSINRIEVLTFIYKIKPISYVISAVISVATALIINFIYTGQIRKINMIESLKSVE